MTREEAITTLKEMHDTFDEIHENTNGDLGYEQMTALDMAIEALQEVQKHEETFEWCHDCKEYDTDNHCCHRWSTVIRNTVGELKAEESVTLYATPKATYVRPLTEEIAIEFLQDSGWLPNHDKEIGNPSMLVRCKDCRYYSPIDENKPYPCEVGIMICNKDDYCSYGERREP